MNKAHAIILASIEATQSDFRALLIKQAEQSDDYAALTRNEGAARGARANRNACLRAYDFVGRDDLPAGERATCILMDTGTAVVALNVACKLQGIGAAERTAAAVELDRAPLKSIFSEN